MKKVVVVGCIGLCKLVHVLYQNIQLKEIKFGTVASFTKRYRKSDVMVYMFTCY